jgi:predicted Zn-dependent protease
VRWTVGGGSCRTLRHCPGCDLPFLAESGTTDDHCEDCAAGRFEIEGSDLAAATEAEVRSALAESWSFVGAPRTSAYLEYVAREVARGIDNAPLNARVFLFRERRLRSLALPSGVVLLSEGVLDALEDEAELAFVLAHDLAHAATSDTARPLVGLGLRALAEGSGDGSSAWVRATLDLIRLGHGDGREHDADARAVRAMASCGYDPSSAMRYLRRVGDRCAAGDEPFAEMALAHPPAAARLQRLESQWTRPGEVAERVNREVFRRMAGQRALAEELVPVQPFDTAESGAERGRSRTLRFVGAALAVASLGALLYFLGVF